MKSVFVFLLVTFCCLSFGQKPTQSIGFIENKGQIVDQKGKPNTAVKYLLNTNGLNVQLRANGFSYDVYDFKKSTVENTWTKGRAVPVAAQQQSEEFSYETKFHRIDIDFIGCTADARLLAEGKSIDFGNYYNVASESKGVLNVYRFQKVTYQNIYPNIDIVFFITDDQSKPLEYNFIVRPNGKVSDIQLAFKGVKTKLEENKIKMKVRFGTLEERLPLSWTEDRNGTSKKEVIVGYKEIRKNVYGFESNENTSDKTIIIDPVPIRLWGTYFGGSGTEFVGAINIDSNNNSLISGGTGSANNIATSGPNTSGYTSGGSYIAKFDTNGILLWSSYYPFSTGGFKLDANDNMYVYGKTLYANSDIPSPGCFQPIKDIYNTSYLIKLNNVGAKLWGTYYGGNENEEINSVSVDNAGNIYAFGVTSSTDVFATPGAHQSTKISPNGYDCGFITKFDSTGNRIWSTYYGGEWADGFFSSTISSDGYLYAIGTHNSQTNITTPGAYQTTFTTTGGMIVKFDTNGNRIWGTFVCDNTYLLRGVFKGDIVYLSGRVFGNGLGTPGVMFETMQPLQPGSVTSSGTENGFISKFNLQLQQYVWGTYFSEYIIGSSVDASDNVFISGYTGVNNGIATSDGYMPTKGFYQKSYLIKLNSACQKVWGTYYGGNLAEQTAFVQVDHNNDIYLYGMTNGSTTGIATANAHQTSLGSNPDTYLVKFRDCLSSSLASSNSPICIGQDLNLTASGGTGYLWTGPNGFSSTQQNPIISAANATHSGQYSCAITGSGACDNTVNIDVTVGDLIKPVPDLPTLATINGDCMTVASVPTATDNCAGAVNGTTTDPLNYPLPGNYTIHWSYTDGNGNIESQTQNVIISAVTLPTVASPQKFCIQQNATLSNITITGTNIKWYDALTGGNLLTNTTILQDGATYYASQTVTTCESSRVPVTIEIKNTFAPTGISPQTFCATQNPTLGNVITMGTSNWYSSPMSSISLPFSTVLVDGATYYATQTEDGCESVPRLAITVNLIFSLNATNYTTSVCDDGNDGTEGITLSDYDSFLITSPGNVFSYYGSANGAENQITSEQFSVTHPLTSGLNSIYVRIDSSNGCHQVVALNLNLVNEPSVTIADEITLCENQRVTVNANAGFDSYSWSTGATSQSVLLTQAGNYNVTVTQNHGGVVCSYTKNFTVILSNAPVITSVDTFDWTDNQNSITVNLSTTNLGDYEYSIDGINFQNSTVFNGLPNGAYTVTVKDKKGCGIATEQVFLLNYPKFFTPNGDGYQDGWSIKFSQFEPNFEVRLFDRYGKLLSIMGNNEAWNGSYNGKPLPSDDYWFSISRNDGRIHKGHFALVR